MEKSVPAKKNAVEDQDLVNIGNVLVPAAVNAVKEDAADLVHHQKRADHVDASHLCIGMYHHLDSNI